ncbi:branched-chain amino acid aminotransferase [Flavobacterium akiainvivens]|uniref:Branched-chain-amino-acid aminotransferase n=1 Tax=Flavobacterium akiainvivens TaxID=1202724 RepID=A0A0M9VGV8_9FLAO|nr:branched-chain amino acid transaminase [Flavobacterium akiainvivens]KOS04892.1 branched-chain amino acid aminotransferase [Flavobacterium akiainvivens]SFQ42657.1 branched-chain amino acid aminotransferase [Flavobacterium akiainvivens]
MYYNENTIVYLNGQWIPAAQATASLYNQTMHYGNGIFEGIRAYDTPNGVKIFKAKEHYERMLKSAELMHIKTGYTVEQLTALSYELLEKNGLKNAYIRPLFYLEPTMSLVPVQEPANLFLCAWEWGRYLGDGLLRIGTSSYQRPNPKSCHVEAKTVGHYINSILATTEAKQNGFDEALMLDAAGFVAEGPGANFFYEKDGVLYTCPLGNILPGITRNTVLELAKKNNIPVVEKLFTIDEVKTADSAFFTGTAAEIAGIGSLDDYTFPLVWNNSFGKKLSVLYQKEVLK